jgi:carbon storage regulator
MTAKECRMLVLSRRMNESIVINHDIEVVVLEIQGNQVRLGFEAPAEVAIQRKDLETRIHTIEESKE